MTEEEKIQNVLKAIQKDNNGETIDFVVPGYATKKIITYQSMTADLIHCRKSMIELLNDEYNDTINICLFHTIVILYGKCFTDATGSKSPKLELSDFQNGNENLLPFHEEIMDLRHNLVAHRGLTEHDFGFAYLSLGVIDLKRRVIVKQLRRKTFKKERMNDYLKLIDFLIQLVEEKFHKSAVKVWSHLLDKLTDEEFAQLKIAGPTFAKE